MEITTVASSYHIEMNPGDAGIYDRYIVQDVIKEIASSRNLDAKHAFKGEWLPACPVRLLSNSVRLQSSS